MTQAQLKLAAIRARLNGVWDHPALVAFGPMTGNLEADLFTLLDRCLSPTEVRRAAREVEADSLA